MNKQVLLPLVKRTRELLTSPAAWIKGRYQADAYRMRVDRGDPNAVCFCMIGAFNHAQVEAGISEFLEDQFEVAMATCVPAQFCFGRGTPDESANIIAFNDNEFTTHDQVLAALDCTIAKLEAPDAQ